MMGFSTAMELFVLLAAVKKYSRVCIRVRKAPYFKDSRISSLRIEVVHNLHELESTVLCRLSANLFLGQHLPVWSRASEEFELAENIDAASV